MKRDRSPLKKRKVFGGGNLTKKQEHLARRKQGKKKNWTSIQKNIAVKKF